MGSRLPVMPAPTIHPTATNKVNVANGVFSPNNSMHADVKMTMTSAHSMKGYYCMQNEARGQKQTGILNQSHHHGLTKNDEEVEEYQKHDGNPWDIEHII